MAHGAKSKKKRKLAQPVDQILFFCRICSSFAVSVQDVLEIITYFKFYFSGILVLYSWHTSRKDKLWNTKSKH